MIQGLHIREVWGRCYFHILDSYLAGEGEDGSKNSMIKCCSMRIQIIKWFSVGVGSTQKQRRTKSAREETKGLRYTTVFCKVRLPCDFHSSSVFLRVWKDVFWYLNTVSLLKHCRISYLPEAPRHYHFVCYNAPFSTCLIYWCFFSYRLFFLRLHFIIQYHCKLLIFPKITGLYKQT